MDQETMLHHLEELAEGLGIEVRYQSAAGRVGVCRLHGERVAIIDSNLRVPERIAALSSVLADEDLNGVYIPPAVRRRLLSSRPLRVRPAEEDNAPPAQQAPETTEGESDSGDEEPGLEVETREDEDVDVHEDGADPEADAD